ncbi:hypothetical protein BMF35_a0550 [Aurantiacibacter gangjinensis]|nr:hypothetical protein BMF35_a0550 [Aurantiacibacter gangjinensis]
MGLSQTDGAQLEAAVEEAEAHPLGSAENPVRTAQPSGQRAYLSRLRCADGSTPAYQRIGSFGFGPYGNIVDGYEVRCPDADPKTVVMDMYHPGHVEERAVAGFTITPS